MKYPLNTIIQKTPKGLCLTLTAPSPLGLHARNAARLVQIVLQFSAFVVVECKGNKANATSIVELLTLGASTGSQLFIYATGSEAALCLKHIAELFSHGHMV